MPAANRKPTMTTIDETRPYPYTLRLADGRYVFVELPPGGVTRGVDGEIELRPSAVRVLDRVRAMAGEVPDQPTPGWVRTLREALGLTQAALAARVGVDKLRVSRWECGRARPGPDALERLRRLRRRAAASGLVIQSHAARPRRAAGRSTAR